MKTIWAAFLLAGLLVSPVQAETVTYLHTDLLGSVVLETDQNRNVVKRYEYEPYGLPRQAIADAPGYTGHVHDAGSGLVYMQQRYYDPEAGRFLSVDPAGVDLATGANFNRYWYGNDSPYTYIDPDGRQSIVACGNPANAVACAEAGITTGSGVGTAGGAAGGSTGGNGIITGILTALGLQDLIQRSDTADSAGDKIRDGTKPAEGRSGEKGERQGSGGQAGADGAFDSVEGSNERSPRDGVRVKDLEGGGTIETHPSTKSADYPPGTPTVKVQDANREVVTTVRYPKEKK